MNLGTEVTSALHLPQAEIPLELQRNFTGIRHIPLFYASYIRKLSHKDKVQTRLLLCTVDNVYTCHPNGDITRCFPFSCIDTVFHDPERKQLGFVIPKEYDLLFSALDTYHLIHVIETLRSMHPSEKPLTIKTLIRPKTKTVKGPGGTSAQEEGGAGAEKQRQSLMDFVKQKFGVGGHRPGVIVGWNDAFEHLIDDPTGASIVGHKNEVCLGKDMYKLNLKKPVGWQIKLYEPEREEGGGVEPDGENGKASKKK